MGPYSANYYETGDNEKGINEENGVEGKMSIKVKTFNDRELGEALSKSPKIVIEYVRALKDVIDNERALLILCKKKLGGRSSGK